MIQKFEFKETEIAGLYEINSFNADDNRGGFTKDYSKDIFAENGISLDLAEVFYARNHKGVVRGLHFQREIQQAKLVRCLNGHIFDVVVDLRKDSPTFLKWKGFDLVGDKYNEILVPIGCAHGYMALEENSIVSYKCSVCFAPEYDDGVRFDSPEFAIDWPFDKIGGRDAVIMSDKDKGLQTFKEFMENYGGF